MVSRPTVVRVTASIIVCLVLASRSTAARELNALPLADMIRETKVALLRVQEKAEARNLPPLKSALLEVNVVQQMDASGSIKFFVVEVGGGPATEASNKVSVTLIPPPLGSGTSVANVQLADHLAESILASAKSLADASKGKPPLLVSTVTVSIKFAVSKSANGGLSLQFPPFEISAGGKIKASEIQTVTVSYAIPSAH